MADPKREDLDDELEREIADALGDTSLLGIERRGRPARTEGPDLDAVEVPTGAAPEAGAFAEGVVAGVGAEDVFVLFGARDQGVLPRDAFATAPEPGQRLRVWVDAFDAKEGLWLCSLRRGLRAAGGWDEVTPGTVLMGTARAVNKGGLEVQIGHLTGFLPASHAALERVEDLETLVGQTWPVEVVEVDPERRRLVVSRRAVLARERDERRGAAMRTLQPGDIVSGTVTRVERYGAFVDVGGVEGLVHVSQMAWHRVEDPTTVVAPGAVVRVQVLELKPEEGRIGLGMKQLLEDPWHAFLRDHPVGSLVDGTVVRLERFGAFVRLAEGVEGLLHVSQLTPGSVHHPREVVREGQAVTVRIASAEPERRRLGLSLLTERGDRLTDDVADDETVRQVLRGKTSDAPPEPTLGDLLRKALEAKRRG